MSAALDVVTAATSTFIVESIMPAMLAVLGAIVLFVFAVYGVLHVYATISGKSSKDVFYKLGRVFGEEIYNDGYDKYRAKRRDRERQESYRDRYDRS